MSATAFEDDRFTMLMACASPGSAWAYHLGLITFKAGLLRRDKATEPELSAPTQDQTEGIETLDRLVASGRVVALP
jgi:hypothetical protein